MQEKYSLWKKSSLKIPSWIHSLVECEIPMWKSLANRTSGRKWNSLHFVFLSIQCIQTIPDRARSRYFEVLANESNEATNIE